MWWRGTKKSLPFSGQGRIWPNPFKSMVWTDSQLLRQQTLLGLQLLLQRNFSRWTRGVQWQNFPQRCKVIRANLAILAKINKMEDDRKLLSMRKRVQSFSGFNLKPRWAIFYFKVPTCNHRVLFFLKKMHATVDILYVVSNIVSVWWLWLLQLHSCELMVQVNCSPTALLYNKGPKSIQWLLIMVKERHLSIYNFLVKGHVLHFTIRVRTAFSIRELWLSNALRHQ